MRPLTPPISDVVATHDDHALFFGVWPGSGQTLVGLHGLASHHRNFAGIASALPEEIQVVAPDLLGRGCSSKPPPGRYGIDAHAGDVISLMDSLGLDRAIVGGHSMGAFVATGVAALAPERVAGLVLIDGGLVVAGSDYPAEALEAMLAPVLESLSLAFPSVPAFMDSLRSSPAWAGGFDEVAESGALYGLGHARSGFSQKASPEAAREDLLEGLANEEAYTRRLEDVGCPVLAIGAEEGLMGEAAPVLGDAEFARLREMTSRASCITVPGTDHYTITMSRHGAGACADAITRFIREVVRH